MLMQQLCRVCSASGVEQNPGVLATGSKAFGFTIEAPSPRPNMVCERQVAVED